MVSQGDLAHALSVFPTDPAASVKGDQNVGPVFLYLVFAFFFSVGLHPVGARWIQEHYTYDFDQETFSYYGPINRVALNMGYHNEHHDLPSIPWNNLPKLRVMAPEF